ncbi:MAG: hypothetical protein KAI53_01450 [Candidatus Aenigmarchaeota archaeon]|nr:hypothetical protein [Candidatus Aenigmarchaeota archaeon]
MANLIFDVGNNIGNFREVGTNRQTPVHVLFARSNHVGGYNELAIINYEKKTLTVPISDKHSLSSETSVYLGKGQHSIFNHGPQVMDKSKFETQFELNDLYNSPYLSPK